MLNPFDSSGKAPEGADPFAVPAVDVLREPVCFSGRGSEYFGIWIVNLVLTILTLGIYSAWAKVRRLQYFHRHTTLGGAAFDYHGDPRAILKGRVIGLILLLAYNVSFQYSVVAGIVVAVALAAVMPALLMRSLRFRAHNTGWRGLRFSFDGDTTGAYSVFLKWPVLTVLTLYLLGPVWHQRLKQYQFNHLRYGATRFLIDAPVASFYRVYGTAVAFLVAAFAMIGVAFWTFADGNPEVFVIFPLLVLAVMLSIQPYLAARLQNLVWNHTRMGDHRFESTVSARRLYLINLTNLLGIVMTIGLFMPFASVRLARYRLESVTLLSAGPLDDFIAGPSQDASATGEETADLFDVDIAL